MTTEQVERAQAERVQAARRADDEERRMSARTDLLVATASGRARRGRTRPRPRARPQKAALRARRKT
jgi:hypothetical protein